MNKNEKVYFGIITSFIYTIFFAAKKDTIIEYKIIMNTEFNREITVIIDFFLQNYGKPLFLSIFSGPAPLLSCRTTLSFCKGWLMASYLPFTVLQGSSYFYFDFFDLILLQNFSGTYLLYSNTEEKIITLEDITNNKDTFNQKKIGLVARQGHEIHDLLYTTIVYPNINKIAQNSYKNYIKQKLCTDIKKIIPFYHNL